MRKRTMKAAAGVLALSLLLLGSGGALFGQTMGDNVPDPPGDGAILADDVDVPGTESPDGTAGTGGRDVPGIAGATEGNGDIEPPDPSAVALDADGNPYPEGGPAGLYNAIVDKQVKTLDGGGTSGNSNALSRLRRNLSRWLEKRGLLGDDTPEGDVAGTEPADGRADSGDTGTESPGDGDLAGEVGTPPAVVPKKAGRVQKVDRSAAPAKVEKVQRPEKPLKPEKVARPERPDKVTRLQRPERPEKLTKVEKPQRPQRPEKPSKPDKPSRPNR